MTRRAGILRWAHSLENRPAFLPAHRAGKNAKGVGIRYERALAKGLGAKFRHGLWWEFKDESGIGYCQTDFFAKAKQWIILLETKLTWTIEAEEQLYGLYVPVVACALSIPKSQILPIVVCKNLTKETARSIGSTLKESIQLSMETNAPFCSVWHHIGGVPLLRELEQYSSSLSKEKVYG
jgi:hypothetical protein